MTIQKLNDMAATVPADAPWNAANANAWDSQTFDTWLRDENLTAEARDLVILGIQSVFSAEPGTSPCSSSSSTSRRRQATSTC